MTEQDKTRLIKKTITEIGNYCVREYMKEQHEKHDKEVCVRRDN